jgi:hypothetical protein
MSCRCVEWASSTLTDVLSGAVPLTVDVRQTGGSPHHQDDGFITAPRIRRWNEGLSSRERAPVRFRVEDDVVREVALAHPLSVYKCLYRAERGGFVMEREGTKVLLPATLSERAWSELRDPYIRNVEAVGSNPNTSTRCPALSRPSA